MRDCSGRWHGSARPVTRKALLGLPGRTSSAPFDLVPERIPFFGAVDDVVVMVLAIDVFLEGLPETLVNEKLMELGIPPSETRGRSGHVRKMVPGPLRDLAGRVPGKLDRLAEIWANRGHTVG